MVTKVTRIGNFQLTEGARTRTGKKIFWVASLPGFVILKRFKTKSAAMLFIRKQINTSMRRR